MLKLGLTGSIGMGKSTTARLFREEGIPVYDADAAVHEIYTAEGSAVEPLEARFPGVAGPDGVDRQTLRARVLDDPEAMADLERIVHPLVAKVQIDFLAGAEASGSDMVVLDIPLLFETGGHHRVDLVVLVTASAEIQRARVLERPGMTQAAFEAILAKQMPDAEKRALSDIVISTAFGVEFARDVVKALIKALRHSGD